MTLYVGRAPLTLVRTTNGTSEYVYAGAVAPENLDPEDAKRLADEGFLEKLGSPAKAAKAASSPAKSGKAPAAAGGATPPVDPGLVNGSPADQVGEPGQPEGAAAPPKAAAKESWVEFAVSQRADGVDEAAARAEADALTKPELIERFGA